MGIETNLSKYLGKMDIISSLSTLSFDKRRSDFFTKELLTLLSLIDKNIMTRIFYLVLGLALLVIFNFMPSTIGYAIDYNKNSNIELKKLRMLLHLQQII